VEIMDPIVLPADFAAFMFSAAFFFLVSSCFMMVNYVKYKVRSEDLEDLVNPLFVFGTFFIIVLSVTIEIAAFNTKIVPPAPDPPDYGKVVILNSTERGAVSIARMVDPDHIVLAGPARILNSHQLEDKVLAKTPYTDYGHSEVEMGLWVKENIAYVDSIVVLTSHPPTKYFPLQKVTVFYSAKRHLEKLERAQKLIVDEEAKKGIRLPDYPEQLTREKKCDSSKGTYWTRNRGL
jgi:hypothetical protein